MEIVISITPPSEDVSALHGGTEGGPENRDMFYFPDMGDLPEFDLPEDLELPNIASDLQVCVRCCVSSCPLITPPPSSSWGRRRAPPSCPRCTWRSCPRRSWRTCPTSPQPLLHSRGG